MKPALLDLNCDLGEGEPLARTRMLMSWITSANVACGGHAGSVATMKACVRLAREHRVRLGAHPGPWSRGDFGRANVVISPDELELLLLQQVGALHRLARIHRVPLHHVKLHGALYHAAETHPSLARRYVSALRRWWPGTVVFGRADGMVVRAARRAGVEAWPEAFADRGYRDDGTLIPRDQPGALLATAEAVTMRARSLAESGCVQAASGRRLLLRPRTVCVHGDAPNAPRWVRLVSRAIRGS